MNTNKDKELLNFDWYEVITDDDDTIPVEKIIYVNGDFFLKLNHRVEDIERDKEPPHRCYACDSNIKGVVATEFKSYKLIKVSLMLYDLKNFADLVSSEHTVEDLQKGLDYTLDCYRENFDHKDLLRFGEDDLERIKYILVKAYKRFCEGGKLLQLDLKCVKLKGYTDDRAAHHNINYLVALETYIKTKYDKEAFSDRSGHKEGLDNLTSYSVEGRKRILDELKRKTMLILYDIEKGKFTDQTLIKIFPEKYRVKNNSVLRPLTLLSRHLRFVMDFTLDCLNNIRTGKKKDILGVRCAVNLEDGTIVGLENEWEKQK